MYRVIQWATGDVGRAAIEGILAHPELELVGCWVHSAAKDGRDVGELLRDRARSACAPPRDVDALLALEADCVLYSPILAKPAERGRRILASGKNVVTPLGWFYPVRERRGVAELEAACRKGGVTLHGTGIHPGGITERFPLMISALSRAIATCAPRSSPTSAATAPRRWSRDVMLFGKTPEQAATSPMLRILGAGFLQSIDMLAARPRLRARPGEARAPRDGRRDRADRLADRRDRAGHASRRSASPGRAPCAASR